LKLNLKPGTNAAFMGVTVARLHETIGAQTGGVSREMNGDIFKTANTARGMIFINRIKEEAP
jgi:hypothetical protein